jgi:hypothetical protein
MSDGLCLDSLLWKAVGMPSHAPRSDASLYCNKHVTVPGPAHGGRDGGCMGWPGLHACAATELNSKQIRLVNRINELYGQLLAARASIHGGCGAFHILRPGLNWCQAVGLILSTKMLASSCAALS